MKSKKIWIISIIVVILIALVSLLGYYIHHTFFCSTEISSVDNSFKISIPNNVEYKIKESNEKGYSLDFYSVKDEMFFYSTVIDKDGDINLQEVVTNEKNSLNTKLNNLNIISDVQELNITDCKSYKYTYTYSDEDYGNDLYSEVVWIETDSKLYIFNLEVITKNMEKYKPIFEKIENSFIENKNN